MGFKLNHKFIINKELNDRQVNLIYYIHTLLENNKMEYIYIDNAKYVWLKDDKILNDNPTFKIKKRSLNTLISTLVKKEIILKTCKCVKGTSIKRTYYTINYNLINKNIYSEVFITKKDVDFIFKNFSKDKIEFLEKYISDFIDCCDNFVDNILLNVGKEFDKDVEKYYKENKRIYEFLCFNKIKSKISEIGYKNYLLTPLWKYNRKKFIENREQKCEICKGNQKLEVHHLSYKNIGSEKNEDLCLLCNNCHTEVHKIKKDMKGKENGRRS